MLGFLVAGNLVAALAPTWKVPHASAAPVNLRDRRAYPEYVADHPATDDRKLITLISNSQAAHDGVNADALYPAYLRTRLDSSALPYRLENWSADGIRVVETELLTRKALERNTSVLLVVLGMANIDAHAQATLDYGNTDIDLLVGEPSLWRSLRGGLTFAKLERDQLASRIFELHLPLVRLRIAGQDWAAEKIPSTLHGALFGKRLEAPHRGAKASLIGGAASMNAAARRENKVLPTVSDESLRDRLSVLDELTTPLAREATEHGTRVIWCWVPVAVERLHPHLQAEGLRFNELAVPLLQSKGFVVHDLTRRIPDELFLDGTHLAPQGHRMMTDLVYEVLTDALR